MIARISRRTKKRHRPRATLLFHSRVLGREGPFLSAEDRGAIYRWIQSAYAPPVAPPSASEL